MYGRPPLAPLSHLWHLQCMSKYECIRWAHDKSAKNKYVSPQQIACLTQIMTCQIFFSEKIGCDEFFYPADKIPHLCTCRCDTDLTISPFTTRGRPTFSDKEYALRVPPVKPGRPPLHAAAVWKKYFNRSSTTIRFLTVIDLIAPRNNCRNNMCQSPWGALHPALHELRGYGWLKLYGMEGEGGHRCFSKAKGPCCCSPLLM